MASAEQIAQLRLLIAEPSSAKFTDDALGAIIDEALGDMNKGAYEVWTIKAANAAELVDISEGGSSRKNGDIYEQALTMAKHFGSQVSGGVEPDAPRYTRVRKLVRP